MKKHLVLVIVGLFIALAAVSCTAAMLDVVNPSFEDPALDPGGTVGNYGGYGPPGWTSEGAMTGVYDLSQPGASWTTSSGDNVLIIFAGGSSGVYQVLTATLEPETQYILTVDIMAGDHVTTQYAGNEMAVVAGSSIYAFTHNSTYDGGFGQDYGTLLSGATVDRDRTNLGKDPITQGQWHRVSQLFRTGPPGSDPNFGQPIKLIIRTCSLDGVWTAFDNVAVYADKAVVKPTISVPTGTYSSPQTVTITCPSAGVKIWYSVDETGRRLYTGPFTVSRESLVTAIATRDDSLDSDEADSHISFTTLPHPVDIVNPSFESPIMEPGDSDGNYAGYAPPGWTSEGSVAGIYDVSGPYSTWHTTDGDNVFINFECTDAGIYQLLTATLQPNTEYTYSVDVIARAGKYVGNELALAAGAGLYVYNRNNGFGTGINDQIGTLLTGARPMRNYIGDSSNLGPDPIVKDQAYKVTQRFRTGPPGSDPNFGQPIKILVRDAVTTNGAVQTDHWTAFDNVLLDASPAAAKPVFSVSDGTYTTAQTVAISCATSGATIYYTTDGTYPDTTSAVYTGPIVVSRDTLIWAVASKTGLLMSDYASLHLSFTGGAHSVAIVNPSFEDPVLAPGGAAGNYMGYAPPGWTSEGPMTGVYNLSSSWLASDGANGLIIFPAGEAGVYQFLTATLQPDTEYTYSVDVMAGNQVTTFYEGNVLALAAGADVYLYSQDGGYGGSFAQLRGTVLTGAVPGISTTNLGPDPLTLGTWHTVSQRFRTGPAGTDPNFGQPIKILVRANSSGTTWGAFDNVRLDASPILSNFGDVKKSTSGSPANVSGVVTGSFNGFYYVEDPDRIGGIRVNKNGTAITVGNTVGLTGEVYALSTGERFVVPFSVEDYGLGAEVTPLGLTCKSLGGGNLGILPDGQPGVFGGAGLNNIGLLVRVAGTVVQPVGSGSFFLDDGSLVPVKAIYTGSLPTSGRFVAVTGISSCESDGGNLQRMLYVTNWAYKN